LNGAAEEILWRGYVISAVLALGGGPATAVVASTLLFTSYHDGPWSNLVDVLVFGALFGLARLRGASLWTLALLHAAYNLFFAAVVWPSVRFG
jgi:membrane protease YdiL (CAAX protease family)